MTGLTGCHCKRMEVIGKENGSLCDTLVITWLPHIHKREMYLYSVFLVVIKSAKALH